MVRLKDIAKETGLTISTVSKALNHSGEISYGTTQLVVEVAKSMGYVPKRKGSREGKTLGVILPEVQSQYYAKLMQTLNMEIEACGCTMITMLTAGYSGDVRQVIEKMYRYGPDGLIICCTYFSSENELRAVYNNKIPAVVLREVEVKDSPRDSICIPAEQGVRLAVEHLLELGHTKLGYVGEYNSDIRYDSFCNLLRQNCIKLNPNFVKRTEKRFERGGYLAACELLKEPSLPTAVVASYDQVAFGAMKAFLENGIKIPEQISIVGFDNVVMADYCPVPLTSVTNPVEQMGITAVGILLDALRNREMHVVQNVSLQSRLVIRESTMSPKKN